MSKVRCRCAICGGKGETEQRNIRSYCELNGEAIAICTECVLQYRIGKAPTHYVTIYGGSTFDATHYPKRPDIIPNAGRRASRGERLASERAAKRKRNAFADRDVVSECINALYQRGD